MKSSETLAGHLPDQIRQEHEGALQDRDQVHVVGKIPADVHRQFGDALLDLLGRE